MIVKISHSRADAQATRISQKVFEQLRASLVKKIYLPSTLVPSIHFCNRLYSLRLYDDKFQTYGKINYIFAYNRCHIFQFHKLKKKPTE